MGNEKIMKILAIIGVALLIIAGISELYWPIFRDMCIECILPGVIYIVIAVIVALMCLSPGKPIPLNPFLLLLLGIIAALCFWVKFSFLGLIGGILIVLAAILGLIKKE